MQFKKNIVVSGGQNNTAFSLDTVESYDVFADKWTSMPNTIENNKFHS